MLRIHNKSMRVKLILSLSNLPDISNKHTVFKSATVSST